MRYALALSTITVATLATVAMSVPAHPATPTRTLPASCRAMQQVPAYTVHLNPAETYRVQSGKVLVRKAVKSSESRSDLTSQCNSLVKQYAADLERM